VVCPQWLQAGGEILHNRDSMDLHPGSGAQPQRTASGHAELAKRGKRLSQRHRTVLLLVDGRRSERDIRKLAAQAGAGEQCLDDLLSLGLVTWASNDRTDTIVTVAAGGESSLLPSSQSLHGESTWTMIEDDPTAPADRPLAEARELLLRAVRQEAPVSGALTLMKLRRAVTREAVEALLDEVEQRLRKPRRQIIAAQTMRHVRHLLSLPLASRPPP
jgi:hypothetical protein